MWTGDATPDDPYLGALHLRLSSVHVCNALAEVELSVILVVHALYLKEGGVWARIALCTLVPENPALAVESC